MNNSIKEKILDICKKNLIEKGLFNDARYQKRLKWEIEEIEAKNKIDYFYNLYEKNIRYAVNQNNLLICWLLGVVPEHSIELDPTCTYGDFPDIDSDYIQQVRNYIKESWAPKTFGEEYVCNIGNYTTFGIKSALIDMVRVYGKSRDEILGLTKSLDAKDDEGKDMTWDAAMKLYPDLKKYCSDNKDIAESAKKLLHRNRGMGVHAGGLIISSTPLSDLVPLVKRKDSPQASSWVEGLHGQDLQPVGLVKFDLLVVSNLLQVALCCELVKSRHNLESICALKGRSDWSDVAAWRNDPLSISMANIGDLKGIFQFDSETVRNMCRTGGVDNFEDLVAYTSLNRPSALNMKMQERYIERKKKREDYQLHPLMQPILGETYGVMIYQEQVMRVLNVVGNIPLKDCELVRKAISKKKVESFIKYKEAFLINGKKNLGISEEAINHLYQQVEAFSEYGFNKSVDKHTYIPTPKGLKKICDFQKGDKVYCIDEQGNKAETFVVNLHDHGILEGHKVVFDDGYEIICTIDHKFLTEDGQISLREILAKDVSIFCEKEYGEKYASKKRIKSSLRRNISIKVVDAEAPVSLSRVSKVGLGRRKDFQISMSNRISKNDSERQASKNLRRLRKNKTRKYKSKEFKDKSLGRSSESLFCFCKKNICPPRDTSTKSRTIEKVERRKPRKICKMHRSCMEKPKTIKNGSLVAISIKMEDEANSLWERKKTGRLCKKKNLDRSRRILSFLRASKQQTNKFSVADCSTARCHVERRVFKKKRCDVNKSGHVMLPQQYGKNGVGLVGSISEHAPISNTGSLVSRKIVRVLPMGRHQMYDLEVSNRTHNFILPNGIVTSNSHAVAYTYISSYLLYLKSHYPNEFYTSILRCEKSSEKIKEYKMEAKGHGVQVCGLDINRSKISFDLQEDIIYFGFSNIKGIGEAPATRIIECQPYKGFEDFLERFGTEANVLKPLIGLRCFTESDPVTLWRFAEKYKNYFKKKEEKQKRHIATMLKYDNEFKSLFPNETTNLSDIKGTTPYKLDYWKKYDVEEVRYVEGSIKCEKDEDGAIAKLTNGTVTLDCGVTIEKEIVVYYKKVKNKKSFNPLNSFKKLWDKRNRSIEKNKNNEKNSPKLGDFNDLDAKLDAETEEEISNYIACERKYYGFSLAHPLEFSPDHNVKLTFNNLRDYSTVTNNSEKGSPSASVGPVEVCVIKTNKTKSKKGTVYYHLTAEDITGQENKIIIWQDDWERWKEEFLVGNLLRLRLQAPSNGFFTFSLESNQHKPNRRGKNTSDKKDDFRVAIMKKGVIDNTITQEDCLMQFEKCTMKKQQ